MADTEKLPGDDETLEPEEGMEEQPEIATDEGIEEEEEEKPRLNLDVTVDTRGACERHITVTIPREDIDRYLSKEYSELMPSAMVPGFRPGRAPRKLVEARYRKDVGQRVKSALLVDSLTQLGEEQHLAAISEPTIDLEAVALPDDGPLTFEFDLEVRPEFDLPQWKGLRIEKPVRDFSDDDVERALQNILARRGQLVPYDGPAAAGDYVSTNLTFKFGDQVLSSATEEVIRIRPVLSFRDGRIEKFDELMAGVRAGEQRVGQALVSQDTPNDAIRGQSVTAVFDVLEVKKLDVPQLTPELLDELGGFELEADLRDAIRDQLERQLDYDQRRRAREQITGALTVAANWQLPPELLRRQAQRELDRAAMELQRSGFTKEEILAHENELRQNSMVATARAMKEHFILERIAEDQQIEASDEDYEEEIQLIARASQESPRRVRARLEKKGSMDVLRNQIIERKVVDLILQHAEFVEVPYEFGLSEAEAVDQEISGRTSEIPEAKPDSSAAPTHRPGEDPRRG